MKNLMLAAVAVLSLNAFAAEGGGSSMGSEYLYQTPADKIQVTPALTYRSLDADLEGTPNGQKTTGMREEVRGEYGISEMFSAGLVLGHNSLSSEYSPSGSRNKTKSSGMEDLKVFMLGRMDMGSGSFRFGGDFDMALEKHEIEASGDSNAATGGMSLDPFVGYEMYAGPCTFGGRLSYRFHVADPKNVYKTVTPEEELEMSGGETTKLAVFYEHNLTPVLLGASLEYSSTAKSEGKSSTLTVTASGWDEMRLNVYVPWESSPSFTLIPQLSYAWWTAMDKTLVKDSKTMDLEVAARFTF